MSDSTEKKADNPHCADMTLRDWFAGHVVAGLYACPGTTGPNSMFCEEAYRIADAMLAAREASK